MQRYLYQRIKTKYEYLQSGLAMDQRIRIQWQPIIYRINKRWITRIADIFGQRNNKILWNLILGINSLHRVIRIS